MSGEVDRLNAHSSAFTTVAMCHIW